MPAEENHNKDMAAMREGAAIFYGATGGRVILKKMAEYFECAGAGRHKGNITATGLVHGLLSGELDVVRVSDGKGFWHETGYDERPEI